MRPHKAEGRARSLASAQRRRPALGHAPAVVAASGEPIALELLGVSNLLACYERLCEAPDEVSTQVECLYTGVIRKLIM